VLKAHVRKLEKQGSEVGAMGSSSGSLEEQQGPTLDAAAVEGLKKGTYHLQTPIV
jgi:hypothetical protein